VRVELKRVTVRDVVHGFKDADEGGVVGLDGKLDIRPPYQREFVYNDKQRAAVIDTVMKGFPLSAIYWAVNSEESFEIIDGQQRTLSICQYVNDDFSVEGMLFSNLPSDKKEEVLNYELMVYFCEGGDSDKLEWFKTVNISGMKLTDQELRNAVYSGPWVTAAKARFSKTGCTAHRIGSVYLTGSAIRQDYLETAIRWISDDNIEAYMAKHQGEQNAGALWRYFQSVVTWVEDTFPVKYNKGRTKFMKGVEWGYLYNAFKDNTYDTDALEVEIARLILDDDVTAKRGMYSYVLTGDERYLSIRAFTPAMKIAVYEKQKKKCSMCKKKFIIEDMEADHITPWSEGGKTISANCQVLCKSCNRRKSNK